MSEPVLSPPNADHPELSASAGSELVHFAASLGVDLAPLAQAVGLSVDQFTSFEEKIPLDRFCRLLEILSIITGDELIGARYAALYTPSMMGPFGYGVLNAKKLRGACDFITKYQIVFVDSWKNTYEIRDDSVSYEWSYSPLIAKPAQFSDFMALVNLRIFMKFNDEFWENVRVELSREKPKTLSAHKSLFPRRTLFDRPKNRIIFSKNLLNSQNSSADHRLFDMMSKQCERIAETRSGRRDLLMRLRELIVQPGGEEFSLRNAALRLGFSERSLQRRLARYGTSYQVVVDETRRSLSDRMLRDTDLTIAQISDRLGFSAPSAYSRSAARWYGQSPSEMRATLRARKASRRSADLTKRDNAS